MDAKIYPRTGLPRSAAKQLIEQNPVNAPERWMTREEAAEALDVGIRTVDRYVRRGQLSNYRGPTEDAAYGVRVLADDVRLLNQIDITLVPGETVAPEDLP